MIRYDASRLYAEGKDSVGGEADTGIPGWMVITGAVFSEDLKEEDPEQTWRGERCAGCVAG